MSHAHGPDANLAERKSVAAQGASKSGLPIGPIGPAGESLSDSAAGRPGASPNRILIWTNRIGTPYS